MKHGGSLGPAISPDGKIVGELDGELESRSEEKKQLAAIHAARDEREARMKRRMEAGDLEVEEWQWEVHKRDLEIRRLHNEWTEKQWAVNRLVQLRNIHRVEIMELRQDIGHQASEEERNGNYKTADVLRALSLRLKEMLSETEQDKKEQE